MTLYRRLFPVAGRSFACMRWLNIALRTLHLVGVAGLAGAYLYPVPRPLWEPYLWLSVISGGGLVALALYGNAVWLVQMRGLLILLKLLLLGSMLWWPALALESGLGVIVLSAVIAHAPGKLRYYSPWHRRCIDHL